MLAQSFSSCIRSLWPWDCNSEELQTQVDQCFAWRASVGQDGGSIFSLFLRQQYWYWRARAMWRIVVERWSVRACPSEHLDRNAPRVGPYGCERRWGGGRRSGQQKRRPEVVACLGNCKRSHNFVGESARLTLLPSLTVARGLIAQLVRAYG